MTNVYSLGSRWGAYLVEQWMLEAAEMDGWFKIGIELRARYSSELRAQTETEKEKERD